MCIRDSPYVHNCLLDLGKYNHPKLLKKLKDLKGKQFNLFVDFLYDYAVIAEGGSPKDPSKYLRQLDKYLS